MSMLTIQDAWPIIYFNGIFIPGDKTNWYVAVYFSFWYIFFLDFIENYWNQIIMD